MTIVEKAPDVRSAGNSEWLKRRSAAVVRGIGHSTGVFTARARNAEIWDVEGKRYVDFAGGIAVLNTGHCHPKVLAAVREQIERFTHTCFQVTLYDTYVELAERLNALSPIPAPAKTALFTTGAETQTGKRSAAQKMPQPLRQPAKRARSVG